MQTDRQIALWGGWIAGPAFGVAMMAAPEYFHLKPVLAAWCFWGGILVFVVTVFVVAALQGREREGKKTMWPIIAMAAGMIVFGIGVAGYFWPDRSGKDEEDGKETAIAGELFLECETAKLPTVGLPNQTALVGIDLLRVMDQGGFGIAFQPNEPGKPFVWPNGWGEKFGSSARCRVINYAKTPLFNLEIPFKITFIRIKRGESAGSATGNEVRNVAEGVLPVTKLEPGNENAYVFYIFNQGRDIANPQFLNAATCLPLGGSTRIIIKITQPSDIMHQPQGLWPLRNAQEIIAEEEMERATKSPLVPAPLVQAPPSTSKKCSRECRRASLLVIEASVSFGPCFLSFLARSAYVVSVSFSFATK